MDANRRGTEVRNPVHYDTIVLGAGISGLAFASRLLQEQGNISEANQLQVLEARDRIGGRIASVHVEDCRLDTGANWIHGTGDAERPNPLMDILPNKRYRPMEGSVLFRAPGEEDDTHTGGSLLVPTRVAGLIVVCAQSAMEAVQDSASIPAEFAKNISVLQFLVSTKAFQSAFELVPKEYHRTLGALFQGIEGIEAAPLVAQSTEPRRPESKPGVGILEYAVDYFNGEQAFLQDGYTAVVDEFAKPLANADAITLETVITRVFWARNPIVIETNRGDFTAREVVCTFPLGVLKDSNADALFVPNLPEDKQEAINNLGFGTLDKVFAIYSTPWWNDEPYRSILIQTEGQDETELPDSFLGFASGLGGIFIDRNGSVSPGVYRTPVMNLHSLTGQPVLCTFVSCKTATEVEAMADEDIGALFHRTLTEWFGIEPPAPNAIHVTRWSQDPYSRGSYSHYITGLSEAKHRKVLQEPIINEFGGVLRFAGEHCSQDHFAMVHGALLDGWRAAEASLQHSPRS
ncbi:unnamed protein product [Periconia digitata]|uniref:Amine oxidase domain-containing protein n=1 Tax=Periconia digitata TaxID=1303443 RepID=A0A9W4UTE3_9PLEO|nr:unnamed protein product [Periconia digitata]